MGKKYIKGKDGKFKGSVPDPSNVPTSMDSLQLPRKANELDIPVSGITPQKLIDELDEKRKLMQEAYRYRRYFPLFSEERREANAQADMLSDEYKELQKALADRCWRCYGTGTPMNSYGDTLGIFTSCPECNRIPSRRG